MTENKIENWIVEAEKRTASQIIVLRIENSNDIDNAISSINTTKIGYAKTLYRAVKISSIFKDAELEKGTNLILINDVNNYNPTITKELYYHYYLQRGIIYIEDKNSIDMFLSLLSGNTNNIDSVQYSFIAKKNFEELVRNKENIDITFMYRVELLEKLHINLLEHDISFYKEALNYYIKNNILCSNLAHLLYKIAEFDFKSNKTVIGRKISSIFGTSSKGMNVNPIFGYQVRADLKLKNIKVYDLNFDQKAYDIKINIAKKLIMLNSKDLTVEKISIITELPQKDTDKLYKEAHLR
ncbi:hypothetical protein N5915_07610 [Arcobacter lacus]|uniref:hypothetical protein n=1 Tax=Arcobacter lacus TaxID=1912876 RepID=UPI0021BA8CB8|nr:hypothetical protein [Arcobacter lacus]MCT7909425.1 hypothetical protein [Arcobacter lacus]